MISQSEASLAIIKKSEDNADLRNGKSTKAVSERNETDANYVLDIGAIESLRIPDGWIEKSPMPSEWATECLSRDFSPVDDENSTLSSFFRGSLISEASAFRFKRLLEEPAHELAEDEIFSIQQVLSKMAEKDAFEMRSLHTSEIAGKRVLIIDGEWKSTKMQFHGILFNADESGRAIQEIFFEAPLTPFLKYLADVVACIGSIKWKS
ncbi:MAG: hypothetical protein K2X27_12125 [Candidatus Obscuribacterales bacterium]|nr:hypothetical protein [Candidatus Obscuribacterales bacterium]